jgi:hypothetical protein
VLIHGYPIGEVGRICSANTENSRIFLIRRSLPVSEVEIAAPIVCISAGVRDTKEKAKRRKLFGASPTVLEIAYLFSFTDRTRKYA